MAKISQTPVTDLKELRMTQTAGQQFTTLLTRYLGIGGKTRARRRGLDMREDVVEQIQHAATVPGYFLGEGQQETFRTGYVAMCGYRRHIATGRSDAIVCWYVKEHLSVYQFVKLLGRMIDAGVNTSYEAELFFSDLRAEANAAYAVRWGSKA